MARRYLELFRLNARDFWGAYADGVGDEVAGVKVNWEEVDARPDPLSQSRSPQSLVSWKATRGNSRPRGVSGRLRQAVQLQVRAPLMLIPSN